MLIPLRIKPWVNAINNPKGTVSVAIMVECPRKKEEIRKVNADPNWRDTEPLVSPDASPDTHIDTRCCGEGDFICSSCDDYKGVTFSHLTCEFQEPNNHAT